jgi:uncharacterized membrane protein
MYMRPNSMSQCNSPDKLKAIMKTIAPRQDDPEVSSRLKRARNAELVYRLEVNSSPDPLAPHSPKKGDELVMRSISDIEEWQAQEEG